MTVKPSRRKFVQTSLAIGSSLLLGTENSNATTQPGAQAVRRVRKSALQLPAADPIFSKYALAVKKMHELPETDGRNWKRQAKIHADHCVHSPGFDFLPWHRHYLNQFEQICGELINDPSFALPYWDWTEGRGKIPDAFFDMSELNVTHWNDPGVYSPPNWPNIDTRAIRAIGKGVGVQDDRTSGGAFTSTNINRILRLSDFGSFSRRLEGSPHNSGHVIVGFPAQGKPGHIGSGLSPLDPLFWLHHCNVDRLWAQWQLGGNTSQTFDQKYNDNFVDKLGNSINVLAKDATDFDSLGYSYQQFDNPRRLLATSGLVTFANDQQPLLSAFPAASRISETRQVLGSTIPPTPVDIGVPTTIPVPVEGLVAALNMTQPVLDVSLPEITTGSTQNVPDEKHLSRFGRQLRTRQRILCELQGVKSSFVIPPIVNVFVNCPYLAPTTPYTDIHYADTFAFFQATDHQGGHPGQDSGRTFLVDITQAVENVDLTNVKDIRVQLMAVTAADQANPGSFTISSLKIFSV